MNQKVRSATGKKTRGQRVGHVGLSVKPGPREGTSLPAVTLGWRKLGLPDFD